MKRVLLSLLWTLPLAAQVGTFHAPVTGTLNSSASTTLTIQQPASGAKNVTFYASIATCPGQNFTVELRYNGTAAANTSATVVPMMTTSPNTTNTALAFSASDVGSGSSLQSILAFLSGSIFVTDLTKPGASMSGNGTTKNLSVKLTNNGSGSCTYTIDTIWSER